MPVMALVMALGCIGAIGFHTRLMSRSRDGHAWLLGLVIILTSFNIILSVMTQLTGWK
jgi:hypothetical protein